MRASRGGERPEAAERDGHASAAAKAPSADTEEELAELHRALAESRAEAQLAARIGRTLLERNQEMDAAMERQDAVLSIRAEQAEVEARTLEKRLSAAHAQLRQLEIARTKAADQAEALLLELERSRVRDKALQGELARTREDAKALLAAKRSAEDARDRIADELAALQTAHARTTEDAAKLARQANADAASENERTARLASENAKLQQQLRASELRESAARTQSAELQAMLTAQQAVVCRDRTRATQLDETVQRLGQELDDVKDALRQEQLCVARLHAKTRELETQLSCSTQLEGPVGGDEAVSPSSSRRLRAGSLFYELSRELFGSSRAATGSEMDRSPSPSARSPERNLLKEFFMLTAAAVKISGAGLGNDACNIHNETLYEEAMGQDVTFDQFHKWLERRLDGDAERMRSL